MFPCSVALRSGGRASEDSGAATFQTADLDAKGRWIKKAVTKSGDVDGTVVYLCDGVGYHYSADTELLHFAFAYLLRLRRIRRPFGVKRVSGVFR